MPSARREIPLPRRLLAFAGYLGLAPWLGGLRSYREDPFLRHHRAQALVLLLWLAPLLFLGVAGLLVLTDLLTEEAWLFDFDLKDVSLAAGSGYFTGLGVLAAGWGVIWLVAMGLALAGSTQRAPGVRGERIRWILALAKLWSGALGITVLVLLGFGLYASRLARSSGGPASVYLLFDPHGYEVLGSWGPKMIFAPVARVASARWGEGNAVVASFTRESFREALLHGKMVVLFVHGTDGVIGSPALLVETPPWTSASPRRLILTDRQTRASESIPAGPELQLLYISGCRTGARGLGWLWMHAMAPTEVVTFDRISGGLEHLWWLWNQAPERLRTLR